MEPNNQNERTVLGASVADLDRKQLCELLVSLCDQIQAEVGTGAFRGGIYPDNLLWEDGRIRLGPASESGWQGQERAFLAPELIWKGEKSPSADVYSLGLLLYYAVNSARMPFYKSGEDGAWQRRMNGEEILPPPAAGRRLSEIIRKATAFQPADRYQSVEELKAALTSCVDNIYLSGPASAETLYHKSEEELNRVEKIMLDIIKKEEDPELDKQTEAPEEPEPDGPVVGPLMPEPEPPAKPEEPVVILTEEKNPELQPVIIGRPAPVQYQNSTERERKIATKVRRRRRRPFVIILLLCAILLGAAAIYDQIIMKNGERTMVPGEDGTPASELTLPPVEGAPGSEATPEPTPVPTPEPTPVPKESTYQVVVSDVSWITARDEAINAGGHLLVINDEEEFRRVLELLEGYPVSYVWVGCRRIEGALTWVQNDEVNFWPWLSGEPTYVDGEVTEDYLMLSHINGNWGYNDNRNDPAGDYPAFYSGRLAYVIEFEK